MNIVTAMYLSPILVGEVVNIYGQKEAQPTGLGEVKNNRNYQENVHTVGVRYTRPSSFCCHRLYTGINSLSEALFVF